MVPVKSISNPSDAWQGMNLVNYLWDELYVLHEILTGIAINTMRLGKNGHHFADNVFLVQQCQFHGCWCPGSLRRHNLSNQNK